MRHLLHPKEPPRWHWNEPAPLFSKQKAESELEAADDTAHNERGFQTTRPTLRTPFSPYPPAKFHLILQEAAVVAPPARSHPPTGRQSLLLVNLL